VEDEVVEGDAVALARELEHRLHDLLVDLDVLEHLQDHLLARQRQVGEGREVAWSPSTVPARLAWPLR